ncbi:MAG: response regulator [Deltaproteobacteria bacterium]|nr:response regulator [Deltaproteobacteria bacterium]
MLANNQNDKNNRLEVNRQKRPTILIVDDEESLLLSLCDVLSLSFTNFEIVNASSAEAAIPILKTKCTELLITDFRLPGMNGLELTHCLKQIAPDTKAILITAYGNESIAKQALNNGCIAYLEKPFDIDNLLLHVQQGLKHTSIATKEIFDQSADLNFDDNLTLAEDDTFPQRSKPQSPKIVEAKLTIRQLVDLGIAAFKRYELEQAKNYWDQALALDSECYQAQYNLTILEKVLKLRNAIN